MSKDHFEASLTSYNSSFQYDQRIIRALTRKKRSM